MEAKTQDYGAITWALNHMRHGHRLRRVAWPTGHHAVYENGQVVKYGLGIQRWQPEQADVLASDWVLVEPTLPGEYHA
jgi:hypothetical protein